MSESAYTKQLEKKAIALTTEGKYQEAYNLCTKVLNEDPGLKSFQRLKKRIEQAAGEENEKLIKRKLKEQKALWKEKKYPEILISLKELLRIAPNDKKIKKQYAKAQKAYLRETEKKKAEFKKKTAEKLENILEYRPEDFLEEMVSMEMKNPGNETIIELGKIFRGKLIEKKIKEKEALLGSDKFEAIENFISELEKIDERHPAAKKLKKEVARRKHEKATNEREEFVYGGAKHLDTLMKLKKYDKAMQVAKEILAAKGEDKLAKKTLKKAKRKLFNQSKNLCSQDILERKDGLKKEYLGNKSKFIRL